MSFEKWNNGLAKVEYKDFFHYSKKSLILVSKINIIATFLPAQCFYHFLIMFCFLYSLVIFQHIFPILSHIFSDFLLYLVQILSKYKYLFYLPPLYYLKDSLHFYSFYWSVSLLHSAVSVWFLFDIKSYIFISFTLVNKSLS